MLFSVNEERDLRNGEKEILFSPTATYRNTQHRYVRVRHWHRQTDNTRWFSFQTLKGLHQRFFIFKPGFFIPLGQLLVAVCFYVSALFQLRCNAVVRGIYCLGKKSE